MHGGGGVMPQRDPRVGMTVAELIERLQQMPQDAEVWIFEPYESSSYPAGDVDTTSNGRVEIEGVYP